MAAEDYFSDFDDDLDDVYAVDTFMHRQHDHERSRSAPHVKTCTRCGEGNLYWEQDNKGFYLVDHDGDRHECPPASVDDFEVLT